MADFPRDRNFQRRILTSFFDHLGPDEIASAVTNAIQSPRTPEFSDAMVRLYRRMSKRRRGRLLDLLVDQLPDGLRGLEYELPDAAEKPSPFGLEALGRLAKAVNASPGAAQVIIRELAEQPKIFLELDTNTRGEIGGFVEQISNPASFDLPGLFPSTPPPPPPPPVAPGAIIELTPGPRPRYSTVQVFEEQRSGARGKEVSGALQAKAYYHAVVSIREKVIGVISKADPRPIREPKQSGPVEIYVTAECDDGDFNVSPRVGKIVLPPKGDASDAVFKVRPLRPSSSAKDLRKIRFRFFWKFNLLESLAVAAAVAADNDEADDLPPMELRRTRQADANDFDAINPCLLHIEVERVDGQYRLIFTYPEVGELKFTAPISLNALQLEDQIRGARRTLLRISASDRLGKQVDGEAAEFDEHLKLLALQGRDLWTILFSVNVSEGIATVGDWLRAHPLPDGTKIQISTQPDDVGFVFAWNLLYDRPLIEGQTPCPEGFWGFRYVVEERIAFLTPPENAAHKVEVAAMYWNFAETPLQQAFLKDLLTNAGDLAALVGPIDDGKTAQATIKSANSNLIYFFAHGHTRMPQGATSALVSKNFLQLYESLPENSETKAAWHKICDRLKAADAGNDRSWIGLRYGRLDLLALAAFLPHGALAGQPLVILNICDSAQVTPSLAESFIDFFLTRGARSVVGTECSMRPVFADFIAQILLLAVLGGKPIGEAVRQTRILARQKKNLLGLAYTVFGSADATLQPKVL